MSLCLHRWIVDAWETEMFFVGKSDIAVQYLFMKLTSRCFAGNRKNFTIKNALTVLATFAIASCGVTKLAEPTDEDAKRGALKYPGYTVEMMRQDKALFEQKCSACHKLKKPGSEPSDKWASIVGGMTRRSLKKPDKTIKPEEANAIIRYLVTMGKQSK